MTEMHRAIQGLGVDGIEVIRKGWLLFVLLPSLSPLVVKAVRALGTGTKRWVLRCCRCAEGEAAAGNASSGCDLSSCPTLLNVHVSFLYL